MASTKAKKMIELHETRYGFNWGKVKVERVVSHLGYKVIQVETPRRRLEVTITPTGLIRTKEYKR